MFFGGSFLRNEGGTSPFPANPEKNGFLPPQLQIPKARVPQEKCGRRDNRAGDTREKHAGQIQHGKYSYKLRHGKVKTFPCLALF
jgi:hypothetical protein